MKTGHFTALIALMALALMAAACGGSGGAGGATPTATVKAYAEAVKKKDIQGVKSTMSKGSLEMMGEFAKMGNKSLDEELKAMKTTESLELRNEVITGETATVEIKDEKGSWQKLPLVKENGQWKIAFDKALADAFSAEPPGGASAGDKSPPSGGAGTEAGGGSESGQANSNQEDQK